MSNNRKAPTVDVLLDMTQKLSKNFNTLLHKSEVLLADTQHVNQRISDAYDVQDSLLLKNLVKYCNDDERIHQLLENAELKQTLDDYKAAAEHIMAKYRQHCQHNSLLDERSELREKYVAELQHIVNSLNRRIEEKTRLLKLVVAQGERISSQHQCSIRQLAEENELLRRQLQISCSSTAKDALQQGQPAQVDCGTQVDLELDSDSYSDSETSSCSSGSFHSFVTSFSFSIETPEVKQ